MRQCDQTWQGRPAGTHSGYTGSGSVMQTHLNEVLSPSCKDVASDSRLQELVPRKFGWLRCLSPACWFGALILFFLPWIDISCIAAKGKVTTRFTMSGAQLVWGESAYHSPKPEQKEPAPENAKAKIEIPPDAFKQKADPKWISGRYMLAIYALLLLGCLSFALVRPSMKRAVAGLFSSLILFGFLLAGSCLLLEKPLVPPDPSQMFDKWVVMKYAPWYYASYLAIIAAFLCSGIELWIVRSRG